MFQQQQQQQQQPGILFANFPDKYFQDTRRYSETCIKCIPYQADTFY